MPQAPKLESLDDFIEWENAQLDRHEFVGSAIREKPGSTDAHNTIAGNLAVALRTALRSTPGLDLIYEDVAIGGPPPAAA